jgi:6-phosphogluconolactonase (cycloisomerase 2 family)
MDFLRSALPSRTSIHAPVFLAVATLALAACGGGDGSGGTPGTPAGGSGSTPTSQTYTISGSISGVSASGLVLQDNGGDNLTVAAATTRFTFATPVSANGQYAVTLLSTPPNTSCSIANAGGVVAAANVTNVTVDCVPIAYIIGGTLSGLSGSGLVLQDNGGDNLTVAAGASSFSFATPIAPAGAYSVTILAQPDNQTCAVADGKGNVAVTKVTNVAITCSDGPPTYTIGGVITGLTLGGNNTLVLQDNGGDTLTVKAGGTFTFKTPLAGGTAYSITVLTQPTTPAQLCRVTNGTGAVGTANITNARLNCLNVGRFVYVVNSTDNTNGDVSAFTIDAATGALTAVAGGAVAAHTAPNGIAIDSSSTSATTAVYVSNMTSADLTELDFAPQSSSTGALTLIGNTALPTTPPTLTPASIAIAPGGGPYTAFMVVGGYGIGSQGALYGVELDQYGSPLEPASGPAPGTAADGPVLGLTIDTPASLLFATTSSANLLDVYSIGASAKLTAVAKGPYATGKDPRGVAVWPLSTASTGFVYTANKGDNTISAFVFDGAPGNLQPATPFPTGRAPVGIAIDPTGTYLYSANSGDGTVSAFSITPPTGALTSLGTAVASGNLNPTVNSNPGPIDIKVDPSGQFVYCVNGADGSVSLFTVKAGALTLSKTYPTGTGANAVDIY